MAYSKHLIKGSMVPISIYYSSSHLFPRTGIDREVKGCQRRGIPSKQESKESEPQGLQKMNFTILLTWMDPVYDSSLPLHANGQPRLYEHDFAFGTSADVCVRRCVTQSAWEMTSGKSPRKQAPPSTLILFSSLCQFLKFCSFKVTSWTVSLSLCCLPQGMGFLWRTGIQFDSLSKGYIVDSIDLHVLKTDTIIWFMILIYVKLKPKDFFWPFNSWTFHLLPLPLKSKCFWQIYSILA